MVHLPVTGDAADAFMDVNAVIEVNVVREIATPVRARAFALRRKI
jgi:hypothetical protein